MLASRNDQVFEGGYGLWLCLHQFVPDECFDVVPGVEAASSQHVNGFHQEKPIKSAVLRKEIKIHFVAHDVVHFQVAIVRCHHGSNTSACCVTRDIDTFIPFCFNHAEC